MDATDQNNLLMTAAEGAAIEITDEFIFESCPARSSNDESSENANNTVTQHRSGFECGENIVEESDPNASQIENATLADTLHVMFGQVQIGDI